MKLSRAAKAGGVFALVSVISAWGWREHNRQPATPAKPGKAPARPAPKPGTPAKPAPPWVERMRAIANDPASRGTPSSYAATVAIAKALHHAGAHDAAARAVAPRHVVVAGEDGNVPADRDTPGKIAKLYGLTAADIIDRNPDHRRALLRGRVKPGWDLLLATGGEVHGLFSGVGRWLHKAEHTALSPVEHAVDRAAHAVAHAIVDGAKDVASAAKKVAEETAKGALSVAHATHVEALVNAVANGVTGIADTTRHVLGDVAHLHIADAIRDAERGGVSLARAGLLAAEAEIDMIRDGVRYGRMVVSLVPGVGPGVAAALAAGDALASGHSLSDAAAEAALAAVPGGELARMAAETAYQLARGKSLKDAALSGMLEAVPAELRKAAQIGLAVAHARNVGEGVVGVLKADAAAQAHAVAS